MTLTEAKATKWAEQIKQVLKEGEIKHTEIEGLIGKLSFSQTMMFGGFARSMMKPLYRKLYAHHYSTSLSECDRRVLIWWMTTLRTLDPEIIRDFGSHPDFALFLSAQNPKQEK